MNASLRMLKAQQIRESEIRRFVNRVS